jgi:hypothetical protein
MFGSEILEVAIGIVFVYLLLSLICTAITELIAQAIAWRSKTLEEGIRNLLKDPTLDRDLAAELYKHPLVDGLAPQGWLDKRRHKPGKPAYIPSRIFALSLFDIVAPADRDARSKTFPEVRDSIAALPTGRMRTALLSLLDEAEGDLKKARENLENWFNEAMDRVAGWYKRKTQTVILIIAVALTISLNVDTFSIAGSLWRDDALRAAVITAAEDIARQPLDKGDGLTPRINDLQQQLQSFRGPIGWSFARYEDQPESSHLPQTIMGWLLKLLGLAFTALAVSLGAPFWFDTLNRLITIRSSGDPPQGVSDERNSEAAVPRVLEDQPSIERLEQENARVRQEVQQLQDELEMERHKGFFAKLFGK